MSARDNTSDQIPQQAMNADITTNTTTNGTSIDTAHFDSGYMFFLDAPVYTDGTYVLSLEDSPAGSTWTAVPSNKLIQVDTAVEITAATSPGDALKRLGAFSTDRYVRAVITSTGVTTGARIAVYAVKKSEIRPATEV